MCVQKTILSKDNFIYKFHFDQKYQRVVRILCRITSLKHQISQHMLSTVPSPGKREIE